MDERTKRFLRTVYNVWVVIVTFGLLALFIDHELDAYSFLGWLGYVLGAWLINIDN